MWVYRLLTAQDYVNMTAACPALDPAKPNKRSCLKGRWIEFTPNIHATLVDVTHHDRHECHWRWLLVADIPGRMLSTRILLGSEPPRILLGTKARLLFLHIRHFLLDISQYIQAANACVRISDGILHNDATRSTAIVQTQNSRSWEELVAHVQLRIKTLQSTSELASASLNLSVCRLCEEPLRRGYRCEQCAFDVCRQCWEDETRACIQCAECHICGQICGRCNHSCQILDVGGVWCSCNICPTCGKRCCSQHMQSGHPECHFVPMCVLCSKQLLNSGWIEP